MNSLWDWQVLSAPGEGGSVSTSEAKNESVVIVFENGEKWREFFRTRNHTAKTDGGPDVAKYDKKRKAKSPKFLGLLDGKPLAPVKISQAYMCRTFDTLSRRQGNWEDEGHPLKFSLRKTWIENKKKACCFRFVHRVHEDGRVSITFKNRDSSVHTCETEQARFPMSEALRDTTMNLHNQGLSPVGIRKQIIGDGLSPEKRNYDAISTPKESLVTLREVKRKIRKVEGVKLSDPEEVEKRIFDWRSLAPTREGRPAVHVLYKSNSTKMYKKSELNNHLVRDEDLSILRFAHPDQFLIIRVEDTGLKLLESYGDVLYTDATQNVCMYQKIKLVHLMVSTGGIDPKGTRMEKRGRSYSVASMWSNYEDTATFQMLFLYVFKLLPGSIDKLLALLTDLAEAAKSGLTKALEVLGRPLKVQWLLCKFHLAKLIRENIMQDLARTPTSMITEEDGWRVIGAKIYNLTLSLLPVDNELDDECDSAEEEDTKVDIIRKLLVKYEKFTSLAYLEMRLFRESERPKWSQSVRISLAQKAALLRKGSSWKLHRLRFSTDDYTESSLKNFKYNYQGNSSGFSLANALDNHSLYEQDQYAEALRNGHFMPTISSPAPLSPVLNELSSVKASSSDYQALERKKEKSRKLEYTREAFSRVDINSLWESVQE